MGKQEEATPYGLRLRARENKRTAEYKAKAKADKEEMDEEVAEHTKVLDARNDKCKMQEFQDSDENMSVTSGSTQQSTTYRNSKIPFKVPNWDIHVFKQIDLYFSKTSI